jgi:hypothetical protein
MKYKITLRNQYKALAFIILVFTFCIGCIFYFSYIQPTKYNTSGPFFSIFFIASLLPVLYLHIEYYYFNKNTSIEIEPSQNKLVYCNKVGEVKTFYFNEIDKIALYMAPSFHRKSSLRIFPFENYHFGKILLKNGDIIIITSLMAPMVENALSSIKGIPVERKISLFASILLQKIIGY